MRSGDNMAVSIICSRSMAALRAKPPDFWGYFTAAAWPRRAATRVAQLRGAAIAPSRRQPKSPVECPGRSAPRLTKRAGQRPCKARLFRRAQESDDGNAAAVRDTQQQL